ncbi:MAG TPA: NADAR family protein [Micromonosporaceae bacterium]|nr:NADAR family protein [Micromonosporaceae bacterium]
MTADPTPRAIHGFRGAWSFLSNFQAAPLVWEGMAYPTSEHAFNAGKTLDVAKRQWIADAATPREAKRRGRSVDLRRGWDERVRFEVMAEVLRAKFEAHPGLARALLATGDAELVEVNTWHDDVWGDCVCGRPACGEPGTNHLGRLLMELRADLAASTHEGEKK